ncbi:type II toxin-antitoxin system HicA family toxin [Pontibacter cellulosilyticus]|uniref:Type II toxin-antitoxin system HicA family toxin n=1 Tax=Pontibacter cellulosilyticus TaxID=1720253 RepID=A0A923NCY4_9BACT|nr:type II toxin-antitoxin system HicA family toxin [Pontibacter cellulosilyticus]MBC5995102.1 type II toxin-antitoxin system HicA family toxin [Pontibacter cellulosilyticus]
MARKEKLIARLCSYPTDFTWSELVSVLNGAGYQEHTGGKTGGSRRKFINGAGHIINLHKPHPGNILKRYQLEIVINSLGLC